MDDAGDLYAVITTSKLNDAISENLIFGFGIFEFQKS